PPRCSVTLPATCRVIPPCALSSLRPSALSLSLTGTFDLPRLAGFVTQFVTWTVPAGAVALQRLRCRRTARRRPALPAAPSAPSASAVRPAELSTYPATVPTPLVVVVAGGRSTFRVTTDAGPTTIGPAGAGIQATRGPGWHPPA